MAFRAADPAKDQRTKAKGLAKLDAGRAMLGTFRPRTSLLTRPLLEPQAATPQ